MVRSGEHARMLLGKARTDLPVIESCIGNPRVETWAVGFHAQQAIEKCIKAVLTSRTIEYPRTHDLKVLCALLEHHALSLPPHNATLKVLNPFAVDERYEEQQEAIPELGPETVTPEGALGWVRDVMDWARQAVAEAGGRRPQPVSSALPSAFTATRCSLCRVRPPPCASFRTGMGAGCYGGWGWGEVKYAGERRGNGPSLRSEGRHRTQRTRKTAQGCCL